MDPQAYKIVISNYWSFILRKRSELHKKECFIGGVPRHPHASFPRLALKKESHEESDRIHPGMKTSGMKDDEIKSTSATAQDSPIPTLFAIRNQSTKLRFDFP